MIGVKNRKEKKKKRQALTRYYGQGTFKNSSSGQATG